MKTPHTAVAIQWVGYLWTAPRIFPKENKVLLGVGLPLFLRAVPGRSSCAPRSGGFDDDAHSLAGRRRMGLMGSPLLVRTQPSRCISPAPGRKRLNPRAAATASWALVAQLYQKQPAGSLPQPHARWTSVSEEDDVGERGNNADLRKRN